MELLSTTRVKDRILAGVLADIAHELSSPFDWETRTRYVLTMLCDMVPSQTAAVGLVFDGWHVICHPAADDPDELASTLLRHLTTLTGDLAECGEQPASASAIKEGEDDASSFLSLPVIGAGQVLGVLHVRVDRENAYSPEDASVLSVVALQLGAFVRSEQCRLEEAAARGSIERLSEEAQKRAAELESLFSSIPDGLSLYDADGNITYMNDAGKRLLDIPEGASVRRYLAQLGRYSLDGEPLPKERLSVYRALRGEVVEDARAKLVLPSGRALVVSASASPVFDARGRVIGATSTFRDITLQFELDRQKEELLRREQHIADVLQQAIVPEAAYDVPGCDIAVRYEPALDEAIVGGDFYDIFDLGDGKIGILVGDVAGKGLEAAIQVAAARHSVRSYAYIDSRPSSVLTLTNDALCRNQPARGPAMLTAFFGVVDLRVGSITYASGGHEMPLVRSADGSVEYLEVGGRALGVFEGYEYREGTRILHPRDKVVIVTDGITEARQAGTEIFGLERPAAELASVRDASSDAIADRLLEAAREYAGGALRDDAAVVVFGLEAAK